MKPYTLHPTPYTLYPVPYTLSSTQTILGKILLSVAIAITLWMSWPILSFPHIEQGGDNYWHYTNGLEVVDMMKEGNWFGFYEQGNFGWPMMNVYQPLYYMITSITALFTFQTIPYNTIHNLTTVGLLLLSTYSFYYLALKLKLSPLARGLAPLLSLLFISGWGSSLETYFNLGMVSFLAGYAFFPLALGKYYELTSMESVTLKDTSIAATFITLTILGHQITAYALFIAMVVITLLIPLNKTSNRTWKSCLLPKSRIIATTAVLTIALSAFYLIPKFTVHSDYNATNYALYRVTDNVVNSFTTQFFFDHLFSGELLDSTDNLGDIKDTNFRWAFNKESGRLPILTIGFLMGILWFVRNIRKPQSKVLLFLLLASLLLTLSWDDIPLLRLIPFSLELQYLRFIFLFNIIAALLASQGIASGLHAIAHFVTSPNVKKNVA